MMRDEDEAAELLFDIIPAGHRPSFTDNDFVNAVADRVMTAIRQVVQWAERQTYSGSWQRYYLAKEAWVRAGLFHDELVSRWWQQLPDDDMCLGVAALESCVVGCANRALAGREQDFEYIRLAVTRMVEYPYNTMYRTWGKNLGLPVPD